MTLSSRRLGKRWRSPPPTTILLVLVLFWYAPSWCSADTEGEFGSSPGATTDVMRMGESRMERFTVASLAFIFALCISMITVGFLYFSSLEDALLRRFQREGTTVEAKVLGEVSFVRSLPPSARSGATGTKEGAAEYAAQVQYSTCEPAGGYTTIVRKRIKALDTDFYLPRAAPDNNDTSPNRVVQVHVELSTEELEKRQLSFDGASEAIFREHAPVYHIDLLVLPEHPSSAVPKLQVARDVRKCWWPTAMLALGLALLTCFCVHMGLSNVLYDVSPPQWSGGSVAGLGLAVTAGLFLIDGFVMWFFCGDMFAAALQAEYLAGGETMVKLEDETVASMSTVSFLSEEWSPRSQNSMEVGTTTGRDPMMVVPTSFSYSSYTRRISSVSSTMDPAV